jgi:hypothetical protein
MGCSRCGGGGGSTVHQVRFPDGTVKRYATAAEAQAAADATGGTYAAVQR